MNLSRFFFYLDPDLRFLMKWFRFRAYEVMVPGGSGSEILLETLNLHSCFYISSDMLSGWILCILYYFIYEKGSGAQLFVKLYTMEIVSISSMLYTISIYQSWGAGTFFSGSGSGSWLFFQVAPAPAPDFFPKRLRLWLLVFFKAAPAPRSQKHPAPTGSGSWLLVKFAKIFFSPQTSKVKRWKNIKQVK